jgi:hypothetical protein
MIKTQTFFFLIIFKEINVLLSVRSSNCDAGKGNLQFVCLHTALDVCEGVVEMLFDLLCFFRFLQVWKFFVNLSNELLTRGN